MKLPAFRLILALLLCAFSAAAQTPKTRVVGNVHTIAGHNVNLATSKVFLEHTGCGRVYFTAPLTVSAEGDVDFTVTPNSATTECATDLYILTVVENASQTRLNFYAVGKSMTLNPNESAPSLQAAVEPALVEVCETVGYVPIWTNQKKYTCGPVSGTSGSASFAGLTGLPSENSALNTALNAALKSVNNLSDLANPATARANLGLGNVNNTADAAKNVATAGALAANGTNCPGGQASAGVDAQGNAEGCFSPAAGSVSGINDVPGLQAALDAKEPANSNIQAHVANTSNPHSVTKAQVGLSNVTNDAQLKAASNLSDLGNAATARTNLGLGDAATKNTGTAAGSVAAGDHAHAASAVSNAPAGSIAATTVQAAINELATEKEPANSNIQAHISNTSNPHSVTKAQIGLANVDNTADASKNVATAGALAANGTNCPGGQAATGVDASGNAEGCFAPAGGGGSGVPPMSCEITVGSDNCSVTHNASLAVATTFGYSCLSETGTPGQYDSVLPAKIEPGANATVFKASGNVTSKMICSVLTSGGGSGGGSSARIIEYSVAKCYAGSPGTPLNIPASGAPVASCDTDGKPVLTFAAGNTTNAESIQLPASVSSIGLKVPFRASASSSNVSGNAVYRVSYACVALGSGTIPTLSTTADGTGTITAAPANNSYEAAISLNVTGCAGKRLYWSLSLVSRTLAADPQLIDTLVWTVQ